jgi:hypothetical protein
VVKDNWEEQSYKKNINLNFKEAVLGCGLDSPVSESFVGNIVVQ